MSKARTLADLLADGAITADELDVGQIGGRRNLIINGAMQVAQRGTSFTGVSGGGAYGADRWSFYNADSTAALTISNSSNAPSKFAKSMRVEVTTTSTPGVNHYGHFYYAMEGQDLQQLGFGTSAAQQFTVSFWCRTNVPATYQWNVYNTDSDVMDGRTFTVNASNAWEYKTLTFSADATNGIDNDNGGSFRNLVLLYAGTNFSSGTTPTTWTPHALADRGAGLSSPTAFVGTVGNYFEITGVQLEVGTVATPFEHRSYGEELALCQRYYVVLDTCRGGGSAVGRGTGYSRYYGHSWTLPVEMRTAPDILQNIGITTDHTGVQNFSATRNQYSATHGNTSALYSYWNGDVKLEAEL
jgi:hypothetical protein